MSFRETQGMGRRQLNCLPWLIGGLMVGTGLLAETARAATVLWKAPNVIVYQGLPYNSLEFENPLSGTEQVLGYKVMEWLDADYAPGPPPWYDDWSVYNAGYALDGYPTEIWMRHAGQYIFTTSHVASTVLSVHLHGDANDGIARVLVDGQMMARIDMYASSPCSVAVLIRDLTPSTHRITVECESADNAVLGAAVLAPKPLKWDQPPIPSTTNTFLYGWDQPSIWNPTNPMSAADDWVCSSTNPVTKVRVWGSFKGWISQAPPPTVPDAFVVSVWTDIPAGDEERYSHPGEIIYLAFTENYSMSFAGWELDPCTGGIEACFIFDIFLPSGNCFYQPGPPGTVYWISVEAAYSQGIPQTYWGWKTRPRSPASSAPDAAVYRYNDGPWLPIIWPEGDITTNQWDLAFELVSDFMRPFQKWAQWPDLTTNGMDVNMMVMRPTSAGRIAADDFLCDSPGFITNIVIWCSWSNDVVAVPLPPLYVGIYPDVPAGVGAEYSMPGEKALWERVFYPTGYVHEVYRAKLSEWWFTPPEQAQYPGDRVCYKITIPVSRQDAFYQTGTPQQPVIYWLVVQANLDEPQMPGFLGWKTSTNHWNDAAVWAYGAMPGSPVWHELLYPPGHPKAGRRVDLAFQLSGVDNVYELKWSQPPICTNTGNVFNGWDEESVYGSDQIVADDWMCLRTNPVTDVCWWGSLIGWSDPVPRDLPPAFVITIWSDEPAGQLPFSTPRECLWLYRCTNYTWSFAGWDFDPRGQQAPPDACFKFECELPEGFFQPTPSNIYWISIAADYGQSPSPTYPWGWKTRPRDPTSRAPDAAVRVFMPTQPVPGSTFKAGAPILWPTQTNAWDMAFRLSSTPSEVDFGDAPATYPTLKNANGAWHYAFPDLCLGREIDGEFDGQPNQYAIGDDLAGIDDEDGVNIQNKFLFVGTNFGYRVYLTSLLTGSGQLDAWVDFNRDGQWSHAEKVADNVTLTLGWNNLILPVPTNAAVGPTFARFRLSSTGALGPSGPAMDGEVEDYRVFIVQPYTITNIVITNIVITNIGGPLMREVTISWDARPGVHYQLQAVTNLEGAPTNLIWFDVGSQVIGPTNLQTDTNADAQRFYRVVAPYVIP